MNTGFIVLLCVIGIAFVISICVAGYYLMRHIKFHNMIGKGGGVEDGEEERANNFISFSDTTDDYSFI